MRKVSVRTVVNPLNRTATVNLRKCESFQRLESSLAKQDHHTRKGYLCMFWCKILINIIHVIIIGTFNKINDATWILLYETLINLRGIFAAWSGLYILTFLRCVLHISAQNRCKALSYGTSTSLSSTYFVLVSNKIISCNINNKCMYIYTVIVKNRSIFMFFCTVHCSVII